MKITTMTALAVITAAAAQASEPGPAGERSVTVCMESDPAVDLIVTSRSEKIASNMFSSVGVTVDWRSNCPADGIRISLANQSPAKRMPNAFAYALPYEGTHIVIFYDRVKDLSQPSRRPSLLAHVLVHEITHILQGIPRHSDQGVMKANWDGSDYSAMSWKPLAFTPEDIVLIHNGMTTRAAQLALPRLTASIEHPNEKRNEQRNENPAASSATLQ